MVTHVGGNTIVFNSGGMHDIHKRATYSVSCVPPDCVPEQSTRLHVPSLTSQGAICIHLLIELHEKECCAW